MKMPALVLILLAVAIVVVPIFTDCESQGRAIKTADGRLIPMKCHWTAQAALGVGLPLATVGGLMGFAKRKESQRNLAITGLALGAVVILLPTALIGVCASSDMLCNSIMKPSLILGGTLVMATALAGLVASRPSLEPAA
jgi:uncharacterized membrane protein (UPF0136 family)